MALSSNSLGAVALDDSPQLVDLIASRAGLGAALSAIAALLSDRFEGATALVFLLNPKSQLLEAHCEAGEWLSEPQVAVGPTGGVIGLAASEAKLIVGRASSVPQITAAIAARSWCVAAPVLAPDGRVLAAIAIVNEGETPPEQVLGVLEVTARLAAMAASKEPVVSSRGGKLDALTGLHNAQSFWNIAHVSISDATIYSTSISVLLVEIATAQMTDSLITRVGTIIAGSVRPVDSVGYLGGGRFGIIAPDLRDTAEMSLIAEQVVTRVERSPLAVRAFLGAAIAHSDTDLNVLRNHATSALELATNHELQQIVIVEAGIDLPNKTDAMALLQMLRSGTIVPHYQPQVDLETGVVVGAEALAKCIGESGPEPVPMLPGMSTSTITKNLTKHMLKAVCSDISDWDSRGLLDDQFKISINATANELCDPAFLGTVRRAIDSARIEPSRLCIEVTESEEMVNQGAAAGVLRRLRDFGLSVAVDDFGTGYSSLSYLTRLPVDLIKIDKDFVADLPEAQGNVAIISAVVDMAKSIGMKVLAEGIETLQQAQVLRDLGVQSGQGWLYSAALSADDLIEFLDQN